MKKQYIIAAILVMAVGIGMVFLLSGDNAKAFSVNDVASDPAAFNGTITITGIMGGVSRVDKSVFGLMDVKELQCTTPNCNKLLIPVKYQGTAPVPGDEVRVTGSIIKITDGFMFVAQNVKVVRHHKIGG